MPQQKSMVSGIVMSARRRYRMKTCKHGISLYENCKECGFPEDIITKPDGEPLIVRYEVKKKMGANVSTTPCPHGLIADPRRNLKIGVGSVACQKCRFNVGTVTRGSSKEGLGKHVRCNKGIGEGNGTGHGDSEREN
jgi:hypothetical protein